MNIQRKVIAATLFTAALPLLCQSPAPNPAQPPASATAPDSPAPPTSPPFTPASDPDAHGIYRIGGPVTPPRLLRQVEAEYSDLARRKKVTGVSTISLIVDADGNPREVHVTRSLAEGLPGKMRAAAVSLDKKALECVRQYRFQPAMLKDRPVPVRMAVEVSFRIY